MRSIRAAFGLAMLAGYGWGQTTSDPLYYQQQQIAGIREHVRAWLDQLPRIICIERTRQTVRLGTRFEGAESTETREDSCDTRQYKLFAVQSLSVLGGKAYEERRPRASDWREQLKEASLTTNTGFLAALVDPRADAGFHWVRMGKINGRAVSVYAFHAPMQEGYLLADANGSVRVPFKGLLYADAVTTALVRVEIQCVDIPRESEYLGADVTVDFASFDVVGRAIDLPAHGRVHFQMRQGEATNEADYRAYRLAEFGANTQITFGDEAVEEKKEDKR